MPLYALTHSLHPFGRNVAGVVAAPTPTLQLVVNHGPRASALALSMTQRAIDDYRDLSNLRQNLPAPFR
jgi:hypothetical protein